MRRFSMVVILLSFWVASSLAQYPHVSIKDLQYVPPDSLAVADTVTGFSANSTQLRWTLQVSSHMKKYTVVSPTGSAYGDTVRITGLCVVPPKVLNWNVAGWTMLLYDTAASNSSWGAILVMANTAADSTQLLADGFLNVGPGDIINMTGVVAEFPNSRGFSGTELFPLPGQPISIIGSGSLPSAIPKSIGDFYHGVWSSGTVQYATGEPYEGFMVEFYNLTVDAKVNTSRGTFSAVDQSGNEITVYDASKYFTLASSATRFPDTTWQKLYTNMGIGTKIDTMRGFITTVSGSEGPRGYRLAPVYRTDIVFGPPPPPTITTHRRNPVVVTSADTAAISVKVTKQTNGASPKTISLLYSVSGGPFGTLSMAFRSTDTTYVAVIPKQSLNANVRYFMEMVDSLNQVVRLANSAIDANAGDTSKGFFFYNVLDRSLTIRDVQYTPYIIGRSPYLGANVTLSGIVTADTAHIALSPYSTGSTNAWYMQSTSQPWSGIWLSTSDTAMQRQLAATRNGDSIAVTGTVQEQFDVTRLGNITAVSKISSANAEPTPVALTTGTLNVLPGVQAAEQYEGMLVRFNDVTVTNVNPTFSDVSEYSVNDGSGPVVVQRSGQYSYTNIANDPLPGRIILHVGNKIGSLTGIVYYSFNQYKFVPRTDADFVNVNLTDVESGEGSILPHSYSLSQNYPNPFNPTTTIQYALPFSGQVTLKVYNVLGQEVGSLVNQYEIAGRYSVRFNAGNLSSGLYFYRIQSGTYSSVRKMMLVK
jgi:hypothetical protein